MALLIMEGFDLRDKHYPYIDGATGSTVGRFGGFCADYNSAVNINMPVNNIYDELFMGFAFKRNSQTGNIVGFFSSSDTDASSTTKQMSITATITNEIQIIRGATVVATSAVNVISPSVWKYLEIRVKLNATVGLVDVRLDGVSVVSYSGNTLASTTNGSYTDFIAIGINGYSYDDLYICDTSTATYNTWLGEIQIETLVPNGDGTFSQLLGSDGNSVNNYLLVDEIPAVMTDKVVGSAGQRDTYQFSNPTLTGQALAVQVSASVSKDTAGTAGFKFIERLASGNERVSASTPASNQALYTTGPKITDPDDAVWTVASISGAQFGIEVT